MSTTMVHDVQYVNVYEDEKLIMSEVRSPFHYSQQQCSRYSYLFEMEMQCILQQ